MRGLVARATVVLVVIVGVSWLTFASAKPAHAAVTCNSLSNFVNILGWPIMAPTYGTYTGDIECILAEGNSGPAVSALQWDLNQCYDAGLSIDGNFGPLTKAALMRAQLASGTQVDGIYGPLTFYAISWVTWYPGYAGNPETCGYVPYPNPVWA